MRLGNRLDLTPSGRENGAIDEAEQLYMKAIDQMESLRGNIRLDEMRMSFGRDKYQVYENIVNLKLSKGDARAAFGAARPGVAPPGLVRWPGRRR